MLSRITFLLILTSLFLIISCSTDSDQKPVISITHEIAGLDISLFGSAIDTDDTLTGVSINWGDGSRIKSLSSEFESLDETHSYDLPDNYTIELIAINDQADSTYQTIDITVDYLETSLAGINSSISKTSDKEFLILTLNMHTYQEDKQNQKFNMISDVIGQLDIDFVALQECAQHKNAAIVEGDIREGNMALVLKNQLKEKYNTDYNFTWDWAHYGWDVWEEGMAVMSKHPMTVTDSKYISTNKSTGGITSRKVVYGSFDVPNVGVMNIFSAHTHWRTSTTSEEQNNQMRSIQTFVNEKKEAFQDTFPYSFVSGDFNGNPTSDSPWSQGYTTMINGGEYVDTFLSANTDANNKPAKSKYHTILGDFPGRIDYIYMKQNSDFEVIDSQIIFTNSVVGKVSDHYGVITKVKFLK